ncbi:MAG: alpha/beta hydrolase [Fimbriiglobus sp.]
MIDWVWWSSVGLAVLVGVPALVGLAFLAGVHYYFRSRYGRNIVRIFEERPLFIIPKGKPVPGAEDVSFPTGGELRLQGCYFPSARPGPRRGVILFGLEFGSNRWSAVPYCSALVDSGYDVFAYEPRNQGDSEKDTTYDPIQWVTDRDLVDFRAAVAYLKSRPDAPRDGIGLFGISKGGSVGLAGAAADPWVRCVATDGAYAAYTTMVPYMKRWVSIYSDRKRLQSAMPDWVYGWIGLACMRDSGASRGVRFLSVERAVRRLRQPLFMIHGGADTYIKAEMADTLFRIARPRDKQLWLVPGAKHNQAAHLAGNEYHRRLVEFFDAHLGSLPAAPDSDVLEEAPSSAAMPLQTAVSAVAMASLK